MGITMHAEHFSINNIPFGIASSPSHPQRTVVTRFEDTVIFFDELANASLLSSLGAATIKALSEPTVNAFAALPKAEQRRTRTLIQHLLQNGIEDLPRASIAPILDTKLHLPLAVGDFTDFSCSLNHVLNASEAVMGRREAPPGFEHFPVGYTSRTSSLVVSGTAVTRPKGQYRNAEGKVVFGPTQRMDYELEVACVIGKASRLGEAVRIADADEHIFGLVLLNDWSARDIQGLEMNPLGPLNGKSFATSIAPWIVTLDALEQFKAPAPTRNPAVPIASYLQDPDPNSSYEISLSVALQAPDTPGSSVICESQLSSLYWTFHDMIAHQTINGCSLNVGDLLATGTISGTTRESRGCLMELAGSGGVEVRTAGGVIKKRVFLEDGDILSLTATAGPGVGFGECVGKIMPSV